jgi:anti-anti-sigma factor
MADPRSSLVAALSMRKTLSDRVRFSQAQGLLVGLTGCSPERAAEALRDTAFATLMRPSEVAVTLIQSISADDDQDGAVLSQLIVRALESEDRRRARRGTKLDEFGHPAESGYLDVVETWQDGVPGVRVQGELDLGTAQHLVATVGRAHKRLAHAEQHGSLFVLDLNAVTFVDLSGLRTLASLHAQITDGGRQLMDVVGPSAAGAQRLIALAVGEGWRPKVFGADGGTTVPRPRQSL